MDQLQGGTPLSTSGFSLFDRLTDRIEAEEAYVDALVELTGTSEERVRAEPSIDEVIERELNDLRSTNTI